MLHDMRTYEIFNSFAHEHATGVTARSVVPELSLLENRFPSTKGRLGGLIPEVRYRNVPATPDVMCQITLLEDTTWMCI
eukprot:s4255_g5.t1